LEAEQLNALIMPLIEDLQSEELSKIGHLQHDSIEISYLAEQNDNLFFSFLHDVNDNTDLVKKELMRCKQSFMDLFEEFLPDKNVYTKFDSVAYTFQKNLPPKIAILGYHGVGKTTVSNLIRSQDIPITEYSTIMADIATLKIANTFLSIWDYTGQEDFIFLWKNFIKESNLILLITDSMLGNVEKSKFFLKLINEESPFTNNMAIANKQDLRGALNAEQIQSVLGVTTIPVIAKEPKYRYEIIKAILDGLGINKDVSEILNKFVRRDRVIQDLEDIIEKKNFEVAQFLFKQIMKITEELGENPLKMEFYKLKDKLEENEAELPKQVKQEVKEEKKIPILEQKLQKLLSNYIKGVNDIIGVIICDRDGFIITSKSKEGEEDDLVFGAIAVAVDSYIERIKREFGEETKFFNITTISDKKFSYCSVGKRSILFTISKPTAIENELRIYSEHIAGKIELLLEGNDNVSLEIPHIIRLLSKTRDGKIPAGEYTTKLILTGDYFVGKTSLIMRFVKNLFKENYQSTVGVDISQKDLKIDKDISVKFIIWDIGGQITQMAPYRKRFYEGTNTAFIVVDRTRIESLTNVDTWYNEIRKYSENEINIVLVGNKSDLAEQIVVTEEDIKNVAGKYNFHYILSSAKTGENVNEAFTYIAYNFLNSFIS
jgi:small GTP-binding protein